MGHGVLFSKANSWETLSNGTYWFADKKYSEDRNVESWLCKKTGQVSVGQFLALSN